MDEITQDERACWPGDLFNRAEDAAFLYRFLLGRLDNRASRGLKRSFVLNIEGEWGRGKTVFLDGLARYFSLKNHPVAQVNAWRDDFASDPMVAFMAALEELAHQKEASKAVIASTNAMLKKSGPVIAALGKGIVDTGLRKYTGFSIGALAGLVAGEEAGEQAGETFQAGTGAALAKLDALFAAEGEREIARFRQARKDIDAFAKSLENLANKSADSHQNLPIFIIVDELDRCRPSYAIALLERIKHVFSAENIVFILGTNTAELANAVGAVYGAGFNGRRYLYRFFDRTYTLPTPSIANYVADLLKGEAVEDRKVVEVRGTTLADYASYLFETFDIDLRGVAQCLDLWQTIRQSWPHKAAIQVGVMLPLIVANYLQMDLGLGATFRDSLQTKEKRSISSPIRFRRARDAGTAQVHWKEVFTELVNASQKGNWNIESDDSLVDWARDNMMEESNLTRQKMLIHLYPRTIATAGRIIET